MAKHEKRILEISDSDSDTSERELSYYTKDKVKLMKEILKIIKPKKIKLMAPDCMKHLDIAEINSMLLEELLGISNKRLSYIFNGENVDRETSSSESEEEKDNIDVISLDDISDDDEFDVCEVGTSQKNILKEPHKKKISHKPDLTKRNVVKIKKEKGKKIKKSETKKEIEDKQESEKEKLMSVLELLELQARARAIKSQLAIETDKSKNRTSKVENKEIKLEDDSDSDAVIIDSPHHNEIVITSESEFEGESDEKKNKAAANKTSNETTEESLEKNKICNINTDAELKLRKDKLLLKLQKIKLIRNKNNLNNVSNKSDNSNECSINPTELENSSNDSPIMKDTSAEIISEICNSPNTANKIEDSDKGNILTENSTTSYKLDSSESQVTSKPNVSFCDNDEIVINVDEEEMDDMENN